MDLSLNSDQEAISTAIEQLARQFEHVPTEFDGFYLPGDELESALQQAEYFDIASIPELGPVSAALAIERLARLPCTTEVALSMLLRPAIDADWPRPIAVVERGRAGRFVAQANTLLLIDGEQVSIAHPTTEDLESEDSLYAYPMGRLIGKPDCSPLGPEQSREVLTLLRVATAAEMAGLMQAAIDTTVEHISVRKQFGRPLGTFQALRHRLAECAVLAGGVKHLAVRAAFTGNAGDAALAALHAQDSAKKIVYDVHQMLGAMGMTLEMSLHLWTYRLKALMSELGGASGQATEVAEHFDDAGNW